MHNLFPFIVESSLIIILSINSRILTEFKKCLAYNLCIQKDSPIIQLKHRSKSSFENRPRSPKYADNHASKEFRREEGREIDTIKAQNQVFYKTFFSTKNWNKRNVFRRSKHLSKKIFFCLFLFIKWLIKYKVLVFGCFVSNDFFFNGEFFIVVFYNLTKDYLLKFSQKCNTFIEKKKKTTKKKNAVIHKDLAPFILMICDKRKRKKIFIINTWKFNEKVFIKLLQKYKIFIKK